MDAVKRELPEPPLHIAYVLDMSMRRLVEELPRLVDPERFADLRGSHMRLLALLPPGGARPTDIAETAGVTKQALGQFVAHLQEHGYVEVREDPSDGRALLVCHTDRGRAAAGAAHAAVAELERRWAAEVGAERFEACREVLAELGARRAVPRPRSPA